MVTSAQKFTFSHLTVSLDLVRKHLIQCTCISLVLGATNKARLLSVKGTFSRLKSPALAETRDKLICWKESKRMMSYSIWGSLFSHQAKPWLNKENHLAEYSLVIICLGYQWWWCRPVPAQNQNDQGTMGLDLRLWNSSHTHQIHHGINPHASGISCGQNHTNR